MASEVLKVLIKNADGTSKDHPLSVNCVSKVADLKKQISEEYAGRPSVKGMNLVFTGRYATCCKWHSVLYIRGCSHILIVFLHLTTRTAKISNIIEILAALHGLQSLPYQEDAFRFVQFRCVNFFCRILDRSRLACISRAHLKCQEETSPFAVCITTSLPSQVHVCV
jgi:hypothetical protein